MNEKQIQRIKEQYPQGTRIELNHMDDPYHPVPEGTLGTVKHVDDAGQIHVKWDNGRGLAIIPEVDHFSIVKENNKNEMIEVIVVEPDKHPRVERITNDLTTMQTIVGGDIEEIGLDDHTVLVCNEEGKLMNLQANRRVGRDVIAGTFFIAGDDGSEDLVSLTDEQVNEYKERFHELEEIEQQEVFEKIEITIRGF